MTSALQRVDPGSRALDPQSATQRLLRSFLAGRSPHTVRGYQQDLERFRDFLGVADVAAAAGHLVGLSHGEANETVLEFRNTLLDAKFSPSTVNRCISSLRSMVKIARVIGLIPWTLEVEGTQSVTYRDTRGPGVEVVDKLFALLKTRSDVGSLRDAAVLRLLYNQGLRRGEVVGVDVGHFDPERGTLSILGKKRRERELISLSAPATDALVAWLAVRPGPPTGPLFVALDRAHAGHRLTGDGVLRLLRSLGEEVGVKNLRPHGMRHTAITTVLERSNGNVRAAQVFSRHKNVSTLQHYDDARQNLGKKMSDLL